MSSDFPQFAVRDFKIQRRGRQRERQKKKKQKKKTKKTSHVHHSFLYISLSLLHDYDARSPISRFMEDVNKQRQNFISLSELGYQLLEIQLQEGSTGYIQFDKVNISG